MPRFSDLDVLPPEDAMKFIAQVIDEAGDSGDADLNSQALAWCDRIESRLESDGQRVLLDYFRANAWANRLAVKRGDAETVWAWDQEELQQQIFLLRRAVANSAFPELDLIRRCQIFTNLANQLDAVGRFVEARQLWTRALKLLPVFWMARANRANSLMSYAQALYDPGHKAVFAVTSHGEFTEALSHIANRPELGEAGLRTIFAKKAAAIERHFDLAAIRADYRPEVHSLGRSKSEQAYRSWCLQQGLFLNPLNDLGPNSIAARDVLTLPDMVVSIGEPPVLIGFFNQLKQEFVSARWLYFEGTTADGVHASDRGVLLHNTLDYPALGFGVEQVKAAFRMGYSLLDKVAFFLNHYMNLGIPEKRISFRHVWRDKKGGPVRAEFLSSENWPLRGLYWLSKDLFESDFKEVMEPDARALLDLRNHLEHKYVKVHSVMVDSSYGTGSELFKDTLAHSVSQPDLEARALRVLHLARSALIYLSLGVHREEARRREREPPDKLIMPMSLAPLQDARKRRW